MIINIYINPQCMSDFDPRGHLVMSLWSELEEPLMLYVCDCRWVREFLSEKNQGLDVLVHYLSYTQLLMR